MWPDRRLIDLFKIEHPDPAGADGGRDGFRACGRGGARAAGSASLPCAMLTPSSCASRSRSFARGTDKPVNLNFFCHTPPVPNNAREDAWRERLKPYYASLAIDPAAPVPTSNRAPFDAAFCAVVEELQARRW